MVVKEWVLFFPQARGLLRPAEKAWNELRGLVNKAEMQLTKVEGELRTVGLTGNQLEIKFQVFLHEQYNFVKEWDYYHKEANRKERKPTLQRVRHALNKLLRQGDILVDSLASLIPILEPLIEFKKTVENLTDQEVSQVARVL
jgi:hypothetical protein